MATSEKQKANWQKYYNNNKERINARRKELANNRPKKERDYSKECMRVSLLKENKEDWLRYALTHAKHRAKKKGFDFDVDKSTIKIPDFCPVLGLPLIYGTRRRQSETRTVENIPTLDRHNNDLGYVTGNVRVISARANSLKSNATIEEIELLLKYMKGKNE